MAISGPHILPDPTGNFLKAFETADRSARDRERLAMEQQRMAENAVQRARENRANDFKLMLEATSRRDDLRQREFDNEQKLFQNDTSRFNAQTSRMGAEANMIRANNYNRNSGDPLGLGDYPNTPPSSATGTGFSFGGVEVGEDGWGETVATVFGGGDDPDDNGLSAFGGKTGPGGREGVAIPESVLRQTFGNDRKAWENAQVEVMTGDGRTVTLPVADLGTAERIWQREGKPVLDLTPGAVSQLGGEVIYRNGRMSGVRGVDIKNVRILPGGGAVSESPPDLSSAPRAVPLAEEPLPDPTSDEILGSMTGANVPPPSSGESPLLPPPLASVPSFSDTDVSQQARNDMFGLYQTNAALTKKAALASASATRTAAAMKNVRDPALREKYKARLADETAEATTSAALALEAKYRAAKSGQSAEVLEKRQSEISALSGLDNVLPPQDRAKLLEEASNPRTGGLVDRKIASLKAYEEIRQQRGLTYQSNGIKTAEEVARAGLELSSDEAKKDRAAAQKVATFRALIEQDKANGEQEDPKVVEEWKKQVNTNLAGEVMWKDRMAKFEQAVVADIRPEPPTDRTGDTPTAAPAASAPAAPAAKLPPVASPDGDVSMPDKPESWTAIKQKFISENPDLVTQVRTLAKVSPDKRGAALKALLGKKAGQRFTKVDRPGALDGVDGLEIATNIMYDEMRKIAPVPAQIGGWKIKEIGK